MPQSSSVLSLVEQDLQNQKYTQAMKRLISVSNDLSHDLRYLSLLSFTQKALGDLAGQIKTLTVIANKTKSHSARLDLMTALYVEGRLNEALDIGLELQEYSLSVIEARYVTRILIKIYLEFSDYEGVEEALLQYKDKAEFDDVMVWGQGLACLARDEKNEAIHHFRQAIAMNPQNEQAWVSLALLHEEMGDRELALANMERALDVNPLNATALKMMMRWHHPNPSITQEVIDKVDFYLKRTEFDEDLQLCYVQMLSEQNSLAMARFEIEKMLLFRPENTQLAELKNHLQQV